MRRRQTYDSWFRTKVREALTDNRPDIPSEDVEAEFAEQRRISTIQRQNQVWPEASDA